MLDQSAIAKKLGLPETAFETETTFDTAFNDSKTGYIARARVFEDDGIAKHFNDKHGQRFGQLETLTRKLFKEEIGVDELASGQLEEMLADGGRKAKALMSKITEDGKKSTDTRVAELSIQSSEFKTKWDFERERADKANQLFEDMKKEHETYKTTLRTNQLFETAIKGVEFVPDMDEIKKKGFNALLGETYEFKLDTEGETLEVYDRATKKRAKNDVGNVPLTVEDAIKSLADKNNLLKKNNLNRQAPQQQRTEPTNGDRMDRVSEALKRNPRLVG